MTGSIVAIYIAESGAEPMSAVSEAELEAGRGILGDRYHGRGGTFSKQDRLKPDQELTLIEAEEIERFNEATGLGLDLGATRRNVVTRGVRLNDLVGRQFSVGAAVVEGMRLCEPCAHLAAIVSEKVLPGLVHRAGLRARIVSGGVIRPEDPIALTPGSA